MTSPYAAPALLIAVAIGCWFLHRWLVRRANAEYTREVVALNERIRAKQKAREAAEIATARRPAAHMHIGPTPRPRPVPQPAGDTPPKRTPAAAYDARRAQVRHEHESTSLARENAYPMPFGDPLHPQYESPAPSASGGGGGSFDGGGASGDWGSSSSSSDSSSSSSSSSSSD